MMAWKRRALLALAALLYSAPTVRSFIVPTKADVGRPLRGQQPQEASVAFGRRYRQWVIPRFAETQVGSLQEELEKLKPLKIKDIKAELDERGVPYGDLLEKAEFAQRLADARIKGTTKPKEEPKAAEAAASTSEPSGAKASSSGPAAGGGESKKATKKPQLSEEELYEKTLAEVNKLRVSEMKKELDLLKVDRRGFFEKSEFAQALARARLDPANRSADDEDPSEYRTVEVKRMPKAEGAGGGEGPAGGARGGGPRGPAGGASAGSDPFNPFSQAGARGGGGGGGGFSSIFEAMQNGGGGFGGMGGMPGMGGVDVQKIMSNPRAMAAFQRAQQNPRIMKALQEMASDPSAMNRYASDPEISSVLKELQSFIR